VSTVLVNALVRERAGPNERALRTSGMDGWGYTWTPPTYIQPDDVARSHPLGVGMSSSGLEQVQATSPNGRSQEVEVRRPFRGKV
jgi:hypothetical protein